MKRSILLCATLCLFLIGCGMLAKRQPKKATPRSTELYTSSRADLQAGKQQDASEKLEQILNSDPDSDLADDAAIELGNLYFGRQQYEQAYDQYMKVVHSKVYSPKEVDALYLAGRALFFLDRLDASASLLEQALGAESTSVEMSWLIHELLFRVRYRQGDIIDSLRSLVFLGESHEDEKNRSLFRSEAIKIVNSELEEEELEYIAGRSQFGFLRGHAMAFLAERSLTLREFDEAARYYRGVIEFLPDSEWAEKGQKFLEKLKARRKVDPLSIGVVLPLSGKRSRVAYRTLKGIQLALGIFGEPSSPYKLAVVDSEGNPDIARRAVERLVLEDHVIAIIGSLLSRTAQAVSETAHEFGVPSLALSQKSGLTDLGDSIFRNSLTGKMQVRHLAEYAFYQLGLRRFAILYPNDPYGVEYANLFWDHILALGGQVTGAQFYQPGETDFKGPIQRLVGTYYIEGRLDEYKHYLKTWQRENLRYRLRRDPPDDLLSPVVDFEAIFIPDEIRALGQIAPMLRFNDVSNVQLLGTNLWNSRSVITRSQAMAEKVLFVDREISHGEQVASTGFYSDFESTFGAKPGHFEIQAYDSARLLRQLLEEGANTRQELVRKLQRLRSFDGVSGKLQFNQSREMEPPLITLAIRDRRLQKAVPPTEESGPDADTVPEEESEEL